MSASCTGSSAAAPLAEKFTPRGPIAARCRKAEAAPGPPLNTKVTGRFAGTAVEREEELELAVRTLLEKLSPSERAVLVLRDAFDYPYRQISEVLELSEANARQLVVRARARLCSERCRPVSGSERRRLLAAFTAASQTGDLAQLERLLADEIMASRPLAVAA